MEFCIEQYTDDGQHIYKQFHILRMKFYHQDFFDIDHVLTHARTEKLHNCFGNTSQVPSNKLMT